MYPVYPYLASRPLFTGRAYRVDIENIGISGRATAADIVRFEREELENPIEVSDALLKELDYYSHRDIIWVTKKKADAEHYLSEGMTEKDISEFSLPGGSRIIADDEEGGYLILRGDAKPLKAVPENPDPDKALYFGEKEKLALDTIGIGRIED